MTLGSVALGVCPKGDHFMTPENTRKDGYCRGYGLIASRTWKAANLEKVREDRKARYHADPEKERAPWRAKYAADPERMRERRRRGSAAFHHAQIIDFTVAQLRARMSYYGFKCWMCGGPFEHVDHVKPLSRGGIHALANLRPACTHCNQSKGNKWPWVL